MGEALVSVVIPTYNYAHFLIGAVESALAQTYPDREVIVVDDGSTDDTRDRLAPFEGRIRYIYQENQGLSAARNTGIRAARGALVAFLDSDDLWHPEKLAVQARYLDEHPEVALLASDHLDMHTSEVGGVDWPRLDGSRAIEAHAVSFEDLVVGSRFGACGVVARKWCFDEVGFFDETLRSAEDVDMWIRIASRFPVAKLEFPLWVYRHHGTSMHRATARMELNTLKMIAKVFDGPEPAEPVVPAEAEGPRPGHSSSWPMVIGTPTRTGRPCRGSSARSCSGRSPTRTRICRTATPWPG